MTRFGLLRDLLLLVNGLGLIWYGAIALHGDKPYLFLAGLSLIFGVVFLPAGIVDAFEIKRKTPVKKRRK